ncbi:MAG: 2-oxo acid dehydrogenase subunit E2, partial [Proteobacteria bacterium]|nr:2-oxo acid dehydrogenase subunit E2 [Pseudomonadota bacterium]
EGLVTPVVRGAEALSLPDLASALRDLTERARARKLSVDDYQGGTFTVSNVGMFGIRQSWPIINPPQAGILGVGAAAPRPVAVGDDGGVRLDVATLMSLTLAADHRAVDGVIAGEFLRRVSQALEHPEALAD